MTMTIFTLILRSWTYPVQDRSGILHNVDLLQRQLKEASNESDIH